MNELEKLAQHRDAILLAELAGLLHNIGKLNPNFLRSTVSDESNAVTSLKQHQQFMDGYAFKRFAKPSESILDTTFRTLLASTTKLDKNNLPGSPPSDDLTRAQLTAAEGFNKFYRGIGPLSEIQTQTFATIILEAFNETWQLTDLLTLFWDDFFYKPNNNDYQRIYTLDRWLAHQPNSLPHLLIHAHGEISGSEKYQITEEETTGAIKTEGVTQEKTSFANLRIATAFGYETGLETWKLQAKQQRIINQTSSLPFADGKWRLQFRAILRHGLGDTQRPINEITLWDYASSIAALFKTSIAKSFLEGSVADANQMHWRLLGVRFEGLDYILQANRIADLVGRRQKYEEALQQICLTLSHETPIASQVYQDENGLFFVVPDAERLQLSDLQALIENRLRQSSFNDLQPHIDWSENRLRGKQLNLGKELKRQDKARRPSIDPKVIEEWWRNRTAEICEVCGLRPVIGKETNYCTTCKNIRHRRVQAWLAYQAITIWLDEVADSNGRLALITGQFPLEQWLDGTLVESLALGMDERTGQPVPKFASFPRVQRIWQTTKTFWQEAQRDIDKQLSDARRRLLIKPADQPDLAQYQVYELDLLGSTRMSVLWDGNHLISTDNLSYTAVQLGIKPEERKTPADAALAVGAWLDENKQKRFQLISDDEKNRQFNIQIADVDYQDAAYATTIPILAEPRTFMALVPADKALAVINAIKTKYEREMGKVRNRLPLHLGAVYFHRRTPLRAALDAGRRMLQQKPLGGDHLWSVQEVTHPAKADLPSRLADGTQHFDQTIKLELTQGNRTVTWHVPNVMGDGLTPDNWYPYVFFQQDRTGNREPTGRSHIFKGLRPKSDGSTVECWLVHANELQQGDQVYFTPATFDFEWLDNSGRRFEIAYDGAGQRRTRPTRPYLLDDLATIQQVWQMISGVDGLTSSQIYALRDLVEAKREAWGAGETFDQLCRDAVRNAQWKKRQAIDLNLIAAAAQSSLLTDIIQLYMGIMKAKPQRTKEDA